MSNVDTPKIEFNSPVSLIRADTMPDTLLEGKIYEIGSTGARFLVMPGGEKLYLGPTPTSIYQYREAAGVAGDALSGTGWDDVVLDTEVLEGIDGVSLVGGNLVIEAGKTVTIESWAQAAASTPGTALQFQARLYNATADAEISGSGGSFSQVGENQGTVLMESSGFSRGRCRFTAAVQTTIKLQARTNQAATFSGAGSWTDQVCAEIKLREE